ncbi:hypothetical protein INR49_009338 [Caranx melampygus]|nr:hypothetical protein INR49_009338 [Caranx melampygus]
MLRPQHVTSWPLQEKVVFGMFFLEPCSAQFSWLFHTVYCHSEKVSRTSPSKTSTCPERLRGVFLKLDYSGIALLIMGSFVPGCTTPSTAPSASTYLPHHSLCLGIAAIIVAQWDGSPHLATGPTSQVLTPRHRSHHALHHEEGFVKATTVGQMGWFYLMGPSRIPERYFPGSVTSVHSHQIFHVLVVAAAFIISTASHLQEFRYGLEGGCT